MASTIMFRVYLNLVDPIIILRDFNVDILEDNNNVINK
jgi:hypothetical protein